MRQILMHKEKCPISYCGKEGTRRKEEKLPYGGIYIRFLHDDGTEHGWGEYTDISQVGKQELKRNPRRIRCPICGKIGIINSWRPNDKEIWIYKYYVRHGKITYGKGNSRKQERCFIEKQEHRDILLKKLDLYIPKHEEKPKPKPELKGSVECPKCGAIGRINRASKNRLYIRHEKQDGFWGKRTKTSRIRRCYLSLEQSKKLEQK